MYRPIEFVKKCQCCQQRFAFADSQCTPDFLRYHDPSEIVDTSYSSGCFYISVSFLSLTALCSARLAEKHAHAAFPSGTKKANINIRKLKTASGCLISAVFTFVLRNNTGLRSAFLRIFRAGQGHRSAYSRLCISFRGEDPGMRVCFRIFRISDRLYPKNRVRTEKPRCVCRHNPPAGTVFSLF